MHSFRWIGPMAVLMSIGCPMGTEAQPEASLAKVEFTTLQDYMIVVPVIINGTGPFKFLLDTGTSRSAVTAKLEAKLGLPASVMGSTVGLTGTLAVSRVHANTVSIGDATVRELDLTAVALH
jgi:predicted aspartyl protease